MVNRRTTSPGQLQRFDASGRVSTGAASAVVDTGVGWRALAGLGEQFGARLGKMADEAAAREGELAGLNAGQRAGASYIAMNRAQQGSHEAAAARAVTAPAAIEDMIARASERHGVPKSAMLITAHLESRFNPNAKNPRSSAGGLYQFIDSTARDYGLANRYDPNQASDAAARLMANNAAYLRRQLGRDVTDGELYLAHQQGAGGAARLLVNPGRKAIDVVGADAVRLNGGDPSMSAGEFAMLWINKAQRGYVQPPAAQIAPEVLEANRFAPAEGTTMLSNEPLALRRDGTIRGEAFDQAAISAWSWRMQAGLTNELAAAHQQFQDDPAGYANKAQEIRARYQGDATLGDPRLMEVFDRTFTERTMAAQRDIAARQERRLREEQRVAVDEGIDAFKRDIERQAYVLGMDPNAEDILGAQTDRILAGIDAAVADGILTPAEASRHRSDLARSVANSRVMGVFNALETPAQKEAFALGLLDEWASGEGPLADLTYEQVRALSHTLYSQARQAGNQQTAEERSEAARLEGLMADDLASIGATGVGLDLDAVGLTPEAVEMLLGPDALANWQSARELAQRGWDAVSGMEIETEAEMDARLEALAPVPGQEGFIEQAAIYREAVERRDELLKQRQVDPLGQAHGAGLIELAPIDGSSVEALSNSLATRAEQARVVANVWGTPLTVFRAGERDGLAAALYDNPDMLPGFALSVTESFGSLAPVALAELSEAGPVLAHVAGITMATGNSAVAADVARAMVARRDGHFRANMPNDAKFLQAASPVLGGVFAALPGTQSAVLSTAQILFEREANIAGFNPADVDKPDSPANAAFTRAIDRALGASTVGGVKYGGVTTINGHQTLVPPDLPADALERAVRNIALDDLVELGIEPMGENGIPLEVSQLRNARLIPVAQGQYRLALGDPLGFDAQYVLDGRGAPFVLDISQLVGAQNRRGATQFDRAVEPADFAPVTSPALGVMGGGW